MSKAISTFLRLLRSRPRHSKAATIKPKANKKRSFYFPTPTNIIESLLFKTTLYKTMRYTVENPYSK